MSSNDELINEMYKFTRRLRPRHFDNVAEIKKEILKKCQEYFTGDIAPLAFYEYCYSVLQEYLKSTKFMTAETLDFEDYLSNLIDEEKAFNRKANI